MKTVDFSETIAASDLNVGRSRHLNEYMRVSDGVGFYPHENLWKLSSD